MKAIRTAAIATLGCKLNQSESDQMARQLTDAGIEIVPFGVAADLCIINSCTVTHVGDRKSRQLIRQAVRANPDAFVAVAGCYAELEPGAVSEIQGVAAIIGNQGKNRLVQVLGEHGLMPGVGGRICSPPPHPLTPSPPPRTRAFVKIQEGCDNCCSYCIVPKARGRGHSLPATEVIAEIQRLASVGYQEAVLTGVNITAYGRDGDSPSSREAARGMGLVRLLEKILNETDIPRLRLSSLQPEDWNPRFYDLWTTGRICRHLHLSLQSGSDSVLHRMRRRYNTRQYADIVTEARAAVPGVAITTDVIAGFPGETSAEHEETKAFLRSIGFAALHVFKYSPRSGTVAAAMENQVGPPMKQERSERLIDLADAMGAEYRSQFAGSVLGVLWEESLSVSQVRKMGLSPQDGNIYWSGISDNYVRVYASWSDDLAGTITGARIGPVIADGVVGTLVRR